MTVPHHINEHQADIRAIKPGWYGVDGPYPNRGKCLTEITQARGNFRASPWLRTIKCPACGGEQDRPCTRVDEGGREWIDHSYETCGHTLSLEEISRHIVNSIASPMSQAGGQR